MSVSVASTYALQVLLCALDAHERREQAEQEGRRFEQAISEMRANFEFDFQPVVGATA